MKRFAAPVLMIVGALAFASMSAIGHRLGKEASWQVIVLSRTVFSMVFSLVILSLQGEKPIVFARPAMWLRSVAGAFGILCTFYAITHLTIAESATLTNTCPIWVVILAWVWTKKAPSAVQSIAVGIAFVGIAMMQQPYFQLNPLAITAALGSACCLSVAMLSLNYLGSINPCAVVLHFSTVAAISSAFLVLSYGKTVEAYQLLTTPLIWSAIGVGLTGTLGQIAMTRAFGIGNPSVIATVSLTQIAFSLVLDWLCWNKVPSAVTSIGMALIIAPVVWLIWNTPHSAENDRLSSVVENPTKQSRPLTSTC